MLFRGSTTYISSNLIAILFLELDIVDGSDRNFDIDIGKKFKLSCCFTSHPYCPTITWYKDGVLLTAENDLVAFLEDGRTLHAHGAPDSEGNYTCKATTPYGNSLSHTIEVNAKCKSCSFKYSNIQSYTL